MFKAEIKSETLKGIVYVISTLVDEVKFSIRPDSVTLKAIDPAHVAMSEITVSSRAFLSFSADESEIGLDLDKVKSVLKLAGPGDMVFLEHDPDQGRLIFRIGNITRRMSLVDTASMSNPKIPEINTSADVTLKVDRLKKGISASESISDHISLEASPDGFRLACEGDTDMADLYIPKSDLDGLKCESKVVSKYPLDYFSNIVKVIPAGTIVTIKLDNDYPMELLFKLAEGTADVLYLLAPRIESE